MEQIVWVLVVFLSTLSLGGTLDKSVNPPGHMLPFGDPAAGRRILVSEIFDYPSPVEFIEQYVLPSHPLLLRGVFKSAPAFTLWDDEYFRTVHEPPDSVVNVETKKKEERNQEMIETSFKSFVEMYRKKPVYMVSPVPSHLERDVPVPYSLQCPALIRLFRRNVMWMSSGGTKSVVHIDGLENLNCLVRGVKELFLVDRRKYPHGVPLDKAGETFSSLDVDSVDYLKYPSMANVGEYHYANLTAGDCLYIPYKWIHQVRSFDRNIAVNLWWDHAGTKALSSDRCKNATRDRSWTFRDIDWAHFVEDESFKAQIISMVEDSHLTFDRFRSLYFEDNFSGDSIFVGLTPSHEMSAKERLFALFSKFDSNSDGRVTLEELDSLSERKWEEAEEVEESLSLWINGILTESESRTEL